MDTHKFAVGQAVDFDLKLSRSMKSSGPYEVLRVLPAEDARSRTYRIKSKTEAFERSAKEYEIVAVPSSAGDLAETFGALAGAGPVR
ncbi:MAG: hypothetical protein E7774_10570 [Bradyrhizobium sp.]|nr:MAG: hypothetical protein E7774_10570 [Bradyrhizobium sp.]